MRMPADREPLIARAIEADDGACSGGSFGLPDRAEAVALRAEVERLTIACDRNADIVVKLSDQREKLEYKLATAEATIVRMQGVVDVLKGELPITEDGRCRYCAMGSVAEDGYHFDSDNTWRGDQMCWGHRVYDGIRKALATLQKGNS